MGMTTRSGWWRYVLSATAVLTVYVLSYGSHTWAYSYAYISDTNSAHTRYDIVLAAYVVCDSEARNGRRRSEPWGIWVVVQSMPARLGYAARWSLGCAMSTDILRPWGAIHCAARDSRALLM